MNILPAEFLLDYAGLFTPGCRLKEVIGVN